MKFASSPTLATLRLDTAATPHRAGIFRRVRERVWHHAPSFLIAFLVAGLLVRFTVQDTYHWTGALYYATPWPILAAAAAFATLLWIFRRRLVASVLGFLMTATLALASVQTLWHVRSPVAVPAGPDIRIAEWNIARGVGGWERIARTVAATNADIIGLIEAGDQPDLMSRLWRTALPAHSVLVHPCGLTILTRGRLEPIAVGTLDGRGTYVHARVTLPHAAAAIEVFAIDLLNEPYRSRAVPLAALARVVAPYRDAPVVILGDFNTPTDAQPYSYLRTDFKEAFESAGAGWAPTWPQPLPVLTLDQVWLSPALVARDATRWRAVPSDHSLVLANVVLTP